MARKVPGDKMNKLYPSVDDLELPLGLMSSRDSTPRSIYFM